MSEGASKGEREAILWSWKLLDLHKSKQGNTTNLNNEKRAAQVEFKPRSRQLSWLGRIKAIQGKGNQSNFC